MGDGPLATKDTAASADTELEIDPALLDDDADAVDLEEVDDSDRDEEPAELVAGRVLKKGDGKIYSGRIVRGEHETFKRGKQLNLPRSVAEELEERGFFEIDG